MKSLIIFFGLLVATLSFSQPEIGQATVEEHIGLLLNPGNRLIIKIVIIIVIGWYIVFTQIKMNFKKTISTIAFGLLILSNNTFAQFNPPPEYQNWSSVTQGNLRFLFGINQYDYNAGDTLKTYFAIFNWSLPTTIYFPTEQLYDFEIWDSQNNLIHRWSDSLNLQPTQTPVYLYGFYLNELGREKWIVPPMINDTVRIIGMLKIQFPTIQLGATINYPLLTNITGGKACGFELGQNYPNPFNAITIIPYRLESAQKVCLTVYNQLGQQIYRQKIYNKTTGLQQFKFYAQNLPSGLYIYRLQTANKKSRTKKMLIIK